MRKYMALSVLSLMLAFTTTVAAQQMEKSRDEVITADVANVLAHHVFYTVFDNVNYKVENGVVTLYGDVTADYKINSYKKSILKHVEGAKEVVSEIKILPASSVDDEIRWATAYKIYTDDRLLPYAIADFPKPIHIIVSNGRVTLEGVVNSQMDRRLAEAAARSVGGVLTVTDNLEVK
jgi:hyperosmotically inducible protein